MKTIKFYVKAEVLGQLGLQGSPAQPVVSKLEHQNKASQKSLKPPNKTIPIRDNMPTFLPDPLFQQSQNVCSSTTLSPYALFMARPLASSNSLINLLSGSFPPFSTAHLFARIKHIKCTAIEGKFLFKKNNLAAIISAPFPYFFLFSQYLHFCNPILIFSERLLELRNRN